MSMLFGIRFVSVRPIWERDLLLRLETLLCSVMFSIIVLRAAVCFQGPG